MAATITDGIRVTVDTTYQIEFSNPFIGIYLFAYKLLLKICHMG